MSRRKWIAFVAMLQVLFCLFSLWGCATNDGGISASDPSGSKMETVVGMPTIENPGNSLIPFEDGRELYILCENMDVRAYPKDQGLLIPIYILSKNRIDPEAIHVDIPVDCPYECLVFDSIADYQQTEATNLEAGQTLGTVSGINMLPYYVYQSYRGVDFQKIGELVKASQEALPDDPEKAGELSKEAQTLLDAEIGNFQNLKAEDVPEFYVYGLQIFFAGVEKEVSFTDLELNIEGQTYHKEIGNVTLYPESVPTHAPISEMQYSKDFMQESFTYMIGTFQLPYGEGLSREELLSFTAPQDMTLTQYEILDENTRLLDLYLTVESTDGNSMDFYWDGKTPVDVTAGSRILLTVTYYNPAMENLWYQTRVCSELDFISQDKEQCILVTRDYVPYMIYNLHELYGIIFEGLDMESYYKDYYYPVYESWREDYQGT